MIATGESIAHKPVCIFAARHGAGNKEFSFASPTMGDMSGAGDPESSDLLANVPENINQVKFSGRCRLFVGNIPKELKEAEFKKMFDDHGEVGEAFVSEKGFGFVTMVSYFMFEKIFYQYGLIYFSARMLGKPVTG